MDSSSARVTAANPCRRGARTRIAAYLGGLADASYGRSRSKPANAMTPLIAIIGTECRPR
ncbi:hypothetical protein C7S16_6516 [Burkholderia thailandensis]|uniref:Uncharacterized protein n=1 Tax=Burkholderia thailandensis TaxID=57975 RepID=A0AAW9CPP6_BURTH|nr:hypothetical protein [Burkholderia thailandensis]